jgi:preprotein translocase subunit SecA
MVDDQLAAYGEGAKKDQARAFSALQASLRESFNVQIPLRADAPEAKTAESMRESVVSLLESDLEKKLAFAGRENLNHFLRFQYLQAIDGRWLDHLEGMEALREAVYLRSYAQKNPLLEYKLEGFDIFEKMIEDIRRGIATRLFLVRVQTPEERAARPVATAAAASHDQVGGFGGAGESAGASGTGTSGARSAVAEASRPEGATVVRSGDKVGRNDPCPCGSGKKYKHCHGR